MGVKGFCMTPSNSSSTAIASIPSTAFLNYPNIVYNLFHIYVWYALIKQYFCKTIARYGLHYWLAAPPPHASRGIDIRRMKTNRERRADDIIATYRRLLHEGRISHRMFIKELVATVLAEPAPSFYIEPETARNYIYRRERGELAKGETARALVEDLYETYCRLLRETNGRFPKTEVIAMAAESPARRFYLGVETAKKIIYYS